MSLDLGPGYNPSQQEVLNRVLSTTGGISVLQVSTVNAGGTVSLGGDASGNRVSAFQGDAGLFHVSAIGGTAGDRTLVDGTTQTISATLTPVSASPAGTVAGLVTNPQASDAGKFRVSAIGGTAGDRTLVDGTTQTISATFTPISAKPASSTAGLVTNTFQQDAGQFRVSALGIFLSANQQISAVLLGGTASIGDVSAIVNNSLSATADNFRVSAFSPDAGLFHVSAIGNFLSANQQISAVLLGGTANIGDVSAIVSNSLSATADNFRVSTFSPDAALFRTSAILAAGVSSSGAANFAVSAAQIDAGSLHASASIFPDTTGGLTTFSNFNVSTSQNIKSTAGAVYGWYAWNMDKNPAYINLYNTSGATNVGTDAIQIQIALAASAAANVFTPIGLKGFTAGISVAAVSGAVSTSNSPPAASAVGINLFYK